MKEQHHGIQYYPVPTIIVKYVGFLIDKIQLFFKFTFIVYWKNIKKGREGTNGSVKDEQINSVEYTLIRFCGVVFENSQTGEYDLNWNQNSQFVNDDTFTID